MPKIPGKKPVLRMRETGLFVKKNISFDEKLSSDMVIRGNNIDTQEVRAKIKALRERAKRRKFNIDEDQEFISWLMSQ